jgi:hypothetical protein
MHMNPGGMYVQKEIPGDQAHPLFRAEAFLKNRSWLVIFVIFHSKTQEVKNLCPGFTELPGSTMIFPWADLVTWNQERFLGAGPDNTSPSLL